MHTELATHPEQFDGTHPLLAQARDLAQGLERTLQLAGAPPLVPAGTAEVDARCVREISAARQSIEVVATVSLAGAGIYEQVARALCRARARGVRVTVLLGQQDLGHPRASRTLRRLRAAGMQVRIAMHAPSLTLLVVDKRLALVRPVDPAEAGLVVDGTPLVPAIAHLALAYWARSNPPPEDRDLDADLVRLTAHERQQFLTLLVSGTKDEVAARELGVSLRTYRRYVRRLMDALGARSRFEAGFLAAERGWYRSAAVR